MGLFNLFKKKKKSSSNNLDNYHNSPKRILKGYINNRYDFDSFEILKSLTTGDKNQWSRCLHLLLLIELSQQQWKRFIELMHLGLDLGKKIFESEINPSGKEVNPALNYVMYGFDGSGGSDLWNVYWEIQKKEKFNIHKDISFTT